MTVDELRALPVSVDLVTAGRAFGLGRTVAHELARAGKFPCQVLQVGARYRVPRSALFEALGIAPLQDQDDLASLHTVSGRALAADRAAAVG